MIKVKYLRSLRYLCFLRYPWVLVFFIALFWGFPVFSGPAGHYSNTISPGTRADSSVILNTPGKGLCINFAATADVHGHVPAWDFLKAEKTGSGMTRLLSLVQKLRTKNSPLLLIEAGDFLQGTPFNSVHHDLFEHLPNPAISALNLGSYDIVVPGNHEFDFGSNYLEKARFFSKASWLAANLHVKNDLTPYDKFKIFSYFNNRVRVGVIGFTSPGTAKWAAKEKVRDYEFEDMLAAAARYIPGLKKRYNLQMLAAVIHGGRGPGEDHPLFTDDSVVLDNVGYKLASRYPQIDLMIMSHTHRSVIERTPSGTLLIEPGAYSRQLALARAEFVEKNGVVSLFGVTGELINNNSDIPENSSVDRALDYRTQKFKGALKQKIGELTADYKENFVFYKDSPALDFIHKVQLEKSRAQISAVSPPFNSIEFKKGPFTMNQAYMLYGFENSLVKLEITGKELKELAEQSLAHIVPGNKGEFRLSCPAYLFLTFEGINMEIDLARPKGSRLVKAEYKNKKIKNSDTFTLAVNSYTANGGAYPVLGQARETWRSRQSIRKMIIDKIRKDKIIDFKASGNMVYKGIGSGQWEVGSVE